MNNTHTSKRNERGFTLIELAIVIAVIGLIIGGIVAGKSLLRTAEINSIPADIQRFKSANLLFRDKYKMKPGDASVASTNWGLDAGCAARTTLASKATCNGNGNGVVDYIGNSNERFIFWHHLYISGILTDLKMTDYGNSSNVDGGSGYSYITAGYNVPESKMAGAGYAITLLDQMSGGSTWGTAWFAPNVFRKNAIVFAASSSNSLLRGMALTPSEAYGLDKKMDDGLPGAGQVLGSALDTNCATNTAGQVYGSSTAIYARNLSGNRCYMGFLLDDEVD